MNEKTLGQVAYEAYAQSANWKSLIHGDPLPQWQELAPPVRNGWDAAAIAVINNWLHEALHSVG